MLAKSHSGYSLIAIVLSIVLMSSALLIITTTLVPRSQHNAELMYSTKAAELGTAVMDEIVGRRFDQQSGPNGGLPVCNDPVGKPCTEPHLLGPDKSANEDSTTRTRFNDVDDFNGLNGPVKDVLGKDLSTIYPHFLISIRVFYDANLDGKPDLINGNRKRIMVVVTDPAGQHYTFSVIRGNF